MAAPHHHDGTELDRKLLIRESLEGGPLNAKTFPCNVDYAVKTWMLLNAKLRGTRGLPVGPPSSLDPKLPPPDLDARTRLRWLRENGFALNVLVPAVLHPSANVRARSGHAVLVIEGARGWDALLSCWAATEEDVIARVVDSCFRMIASPQLNAWGEFTGHTLLADERSPGCKQRDLDRIFIATNFDEERSAGTEASLANHEKALMRFEFLEALVRAAVARFLDAGKRGSSGRKGNAKGANGAKAVSSASGGTGDARRADLEGQLAAMGPATEFVGAWERLMHVVVLPGVETEATFDSDAFRRDRLYNEDVDILLTERLPLLEAIFNHYRKLASSAENRERLDMVEWMELMSESRLYHRHFTQRESKLCFVWSRMRWRDESSTTKAWNTNRSLSFIDFLEALGRVADMCNPPPVEELLADEKYGSSDTPTAEYYKRAGETHAYFADRPSAGLFSPKTRPLDEKLEQVLEVIGAGLMEHFQVHSEEKLLAKLAHGRGRNYQLGRAAMS
ncbi:hypothetical protein FOA52_002382 [Chlamydomonas sp. UWO 241]|nr:hypothetical protein FOA52_002382 [Chlamydomonas sp. UWO 241]